MNEWQALLFLDCLHTFLQTRVMTVSDGHQVSVTNAHSLNFALIVVCAQCVVYVSERSCGVIVVHWEGYCWAMAFNALVTRFNDLYIERRSLKSFFVLYEEWTVSCTINDFLYQSLCCLVILDMFFITQAFYMNTLIGYQYFFVRIDVCFIFINFLAI